MNLPPFILASGSPVRKKILSDFGCEFTCVVSNAPESFRDSETLYENAERLALEKALAVQKMHPDSIIVGSDSIMTDPTGLFLEKPKDRTDALSMMKNRSGRKEIIVSGLAIVYKDKVYTGHDQAIMYWKEMPEREIEDVIGTQEWEGKCGGVMIEGLTGTYIEKIEGSVTTIMGFPLQAFWREMRNSFQHEKKGV